MYIVSEYQLKYNLIYVLFKLPFRNLWSMTLFSALLIIILTFLHTMMTVHEYFYLL